MNPTLPKTIPHLKYTEQKSIQHTETYIKEDKTNLPDEYHLKKVCSTVPAISDADIWNIFHRYYYVMDYVIAFLIIAFYVFIMRSKSC